MQYNTIRQYQEGGLRRRARSLLSGIDRGRKIRREQKFISEDAKKLVLQRGLGSLFSTVGKLAGVPTFVSDFVGNTVGDLLVKDPKFKSRTGYLQEDSAYGSGYDALARVNRADKSGRLGRAIGAQAASTVGDFISSGGLKSAVGKARASLGLGSGQPLTTADGKLLSSAVPADIEGASYIDSLLPDSPSTTDNIRLSDADMTMDVPLAGDVEVPDFDASLPDVSDLPKPPSDIEMQRRRSVPSSADAEMLGDIEIPSLIGGMIRSGELDEQGLPDVSGLPSKSEIDYLASLRSSDELGSLNRALDVSQTAQSQAMQTSREMQNLINYLTPKPTVADFLQMRQRLMSGYAGGGLFNPMKTERRIF